VHTRLLLKLRKRKPLKLNQSPQVLALQTPRLGIPGRRDTMLRHASTISETASGQIVDPSSSSNTTTRLWRCRAVLLKMCLVLQTAAKFLLGETEYRRLFIESQMEVPKTVSKIHSQHHPNGQLIGRQLAKGVGTKDQKKAQNDPAVCQHPSHALKARSNKTLKWWTCLQCQSRWERLDADEVGLTMDEPDDMTVICFGKHKHSASTYLEVYDRDKGYCKWVKMTAETGDASPQLRRFAIYLQKKDLEETDPAL
jgi:hypothetical protein